MDMAGQERERERERERENGGRIIPGRPRGTQNDTLTRVMYRNQNTQRSLPTPLSNRDELAEQLPRL